MKQQTTYLKIDQNFRLVYANLVSRLVGKFGVHNLELIENAVMESYFKALKTWPYSQVPENENGWMYRVSHNALLDSFRKNSRPGLYRNEDAYISSDNHSDIIEDPELNLLFMICIPELKPRDQLAFMLKTLSGFGLKEIASALLTNEETIKKRLARARKKLDKNKLQPRQSYADLEHRRNMVHKAIYLLFNEGYYSSSEDQKMKKECCIEAMRFCKYLSEHDWANEDTFGLMSLMCYHIARIPGRFDASENLISLKDQDRSKWDQSFIALGNHYLQRAGDYSNGSRYQIEAAISAYHCAAKSHEDTNWDTLDLMYSKLYKMEPSALILMNVVAVKIQKDELNEALRLFKLIDENEINNQKLEHYLLGAELYGKLQMHFEQNSLIKMALKESKDENQVNWIKDNYLHNN